MVKNMLYIEDRKIPKQAVLAVLPVKGEKGIKSILLLANGETLQTPLSPFALKKRLDGAPLPPYAASLSKKQ